MKFPYLLAFVIIILLNSCGSTNTQTLFNSPSDIDVTKLKDIYVVNDQGPSEVFYRIKEGDVISIRNLQNKNWGGGQPTAGGSEVNTAATNTVDPNAVSYIVDNNGMVTLPALTSPKVKVAGLTRREARQKIEDLYDTKGLVDPIIELNIVNLKVTLIGEFTKTGPYLLTKDNTTLIEAISEFGISKTADPRTLKITRGKEKIYVNLTNDAIIGNPKLILQNGDIISIKPNKNALDGEKIQRFNNVIQPLLVVVNLVILVFTLSK